jgi:hypothetical protein
MAFIVEPIALDRALQLGNEEFIRPMSFGTNWSKIRIGVVAALNATQGLRQAGFLMGVCAGAGSSWKTVNTSEFVGVHFGATVENSTYAYVLGPPAYFTQAGVSVPSVTKLAGVVSNRGGANTTAYFGAMPSTTRVAYFLDITKGSSYIVNALWPNSIANAQADNSIATFIANMETDGTPTNTASLGAQTFAYAGAGLLDTLNLSWNHSTPVMTIFAIAVCRFT